MRQNYLPLNFFPIKCYEFRCSQLLLDNTLGLVKDLEYKSFNEPTGVLTSADIQQRESFAPLMSWFQQCVDTMHVDTGLNCDRLVVNKAWSNKSVGESGHHHDAHRHLGISRSRFAMLFQVQVGMLFFHLTRLP